jgi:hypothetical protein
MNCVDSSGREPNSQVSSQLVVQGETLKGFRRLACVTCTLIATVAGIGAGSGHVFAGYVSCQTDPVVVLSNGKSVQLAATIYDDASDVESVAYSLHGPAGTSVVSVTYSGDLPASMESFTYTADAKAGQYPATTTVVTGASGIQVSALESAGGPRQTQTVNGSSNQPIATQVNAP